MDYFFALWKVIRILTRRRTDRLPLYKSLEDWSKGIHDPFFSKEIIRRGEQPSSNMHATARGMAKVASAMANKGQPPPGERRIITEKTWEQMHSEPKTALDHALGKSLE